jgi:hypothetical protein
MRQPDRRQLEQLVSLMEGSTPRPGRGAGQEGAPKPTPQSFEALTKAIDDIPRLGALRTAAEQVRAQRADALRQVIDESKRVAAEQAMAIIDGRGRLIDGVAPEPQGVAPEIEPSLPVEFVRSSPGASLRDHQVAEGDTWARWDCTVSGDAIRTTATETLSFFFLWQNPRRRNVHVNVTTGLSLLGHAQASADGNGFPASLFFPDGRVDVDVRARLTVWPLWLPHTAQPFQTTDVASCAAEGGTFGDADTVAIASNVALQAVRYFVPRTAYLLVETSVVADFRCLSGTGVVDFGSTDAFRADYPYCFVTEE